MCLGITINSAINLSTCWRQLIQTQTDELLFMKLLCRAILPCRAILLSLGKGLYCTTSTMYYDHRSCAQPGERAYAAVSHNCSIFAHLTHTQPTHILYLITKVVNLNRIQGPFTDHEGVQLEQDSRPSDHKGVQSEQDSEPDSTWSSWIT